MDFRWRLRCRKMFVRQAHDHVVCNFVQSTHFISKEADRKKRLKCVRTRADHSRGWTMQERVEQEPIPDFLRGGGEMAARMRSHNWSTSPLGAPSTWPQS